MALQSDRKSMNGFAGCNKMMGSYTIKGEELSFSPIGATMMMCPSGMELEAAFTGALGRVKFYRRKGETLELLDGRRQPLLNFSSKEEVPVPQKTYVYKCDGGYSFVARIEGENAWLFLPGKTVKFPRLSAKGGGGYGDGNGTLTILGEEARLRFDGVWHRGCRNDRKAAVWEDAKLNGVDFRAVGNEPPWSVEIKRGDNITLRTGYDNNTLRFLTPEPKEDKEGGRTIYSTEKDGRRLRVELSLGPCRDTMSGDTYETEAVVWLDGKKFTGCGRALH